MGATRLVPTCRIPRGLSKTLSPEALTATCVRRKDGWFVTDDVFCNLYDVTERDGGVRLAGALVGLIH